MCLPITIYPPTVKMYRRNRHGRSSGNKPRRQPTGYLPLSDAKIADVSLVVFVIVAAVFAHVELAVRTQASSLEQC